MSSVHIRELSSMRGIAALVVVVGHVFRIIDWRASGHSAFSGTVFDFIGRSFNGQASVEIFFVLSGLVLSLSLERNGENRLNWLSGFYIRRVFRIYPALWISLFLALILMPVEQAACASGTCTPFAAGAYQGDFTLRQILLSFAGLFVHINGPMWSLRTELAYSFVFPGMFLALRHPKMRIPFFIFVLALALLPIPRLYSVHYAVAFALGSLIPLIPAKKGVPYGLMALVALVVLVFARAVMFSSDITKLSELVEIAAAFFVVYAVYHKRDSVAFLRNGTLFYLGEVSYSIYILHWPLLFVSLYALVSFAGASAIAQSPYLYTAVLGIVVCAMTFAASVINYSYIEKPFQALGRLLSRNMSKMLVKDQSSRELA